MARAKLPEAVWRDSTGAAVAVVEMRARAAAATAEMYIIFVSEGVRV